MRRLAAATITTLLSAALLGTGAATAQASATGDWAGFSAHVLGGFHLKRVDTQTGQTHLAYLLCTTTRSHGGAAVIHGAGGVKDATSACEELARVDGDFDALSVHPNWLPPMLMAPVDVRVAGTWHGRKIAWSHEYTNGGALAKATGNVFAF